MDGTVDALKNLYVALGGELTDTYDDICSGEVVANYVIIPDVINAIAQLKSADGGSLPVVTAEDDGKVLTVVDGEWAAAEA